MTSMPQDFKKIEIFGYFKLLSNEFCSNYISPVGLFYAIFRLTNFPSDAFEVSSAKRDKQVAPGRH